MKIAMLSPFNPYRGGIAQFSDRLLVELAKNQEVKAFTFSKMYPDFLFPGKTQYVPDADFSNHKNRVLNSINPLSYKKTANRINDYKPDVLIVAYWMPFIAPAYAAVCSFLNKNIKIIGLIHNALPHERGMLDKSLAKLFFNRCDAFVCMSDAVKNDLLELNSKARILVHPHPIYDHYGEPIDKDVACRKLGIESFKKNLLFFGLIRDYKGLDLLIQAMDYLEYDYQLLIAGESYGDFSKYLNLIADSKLQNNIFVHQMYISDEEVGIFFSASDVLVLPYRSATQSGVIAISYQLETPMVATDVGALGGTLRSSQTGVVADALIPQSLANAIKEIFSDKERFNLFKENTKHEKLRLSWNGFADALNSFVGKLN